MKCISQLLITGAISSVAACTALAIALHKPIQRTVRCYDPDKWCETGKVCTPNSKLCVDKVVMCQDNDHFCTDEQICTPDNKSCVDNISYCVDKIHWCSDNMICSNDSTKCIQMYRSRD